MHRYKQARPTLGMKTTKVSDAVAEIANAAVGWNGNGEVSAAYVFGALRTARLCVGLNTRERQELRFALSKKAEETYRSNALVGA